MVASKGKSADPNSLRAQLRTIQHSMPHAHVQVVESMGTQGLVVLVDTERDGVVILQLHSIKKERDTVSLKGFRVEGEEVVQKSRSIALFPSGKAYLC